jgi:probable F420-dependent oxidoreductase
MELGRIGIWSANLDSPPIEQLPAIARELEELGYDALWIPVVAGRDPFVKAALMLAGTERLVLATGIATIYRSDPIAMASVWKTLTDAFPGRFLLGLGVSHRPTVEGLRNHEYGPPLTAMREYLDGMDAAPYFARPPSAEPVRALAALGPKMLALAAERAVGAHPYFVPVEHTAQAREILGAGPLLAPEQAVVLETDPEQARAIARTHLAMYLPLPNYMNNFRRLGFGDDDVLKGGSDRFVDAIVAWGDVDAIAKRVAAMRDAGADHVCVQVIRPDDELPRADWRELAPALTAS